MDKGLFKQAGIDVTGILTSQGGGTTMRNVLSGGLPCWRSGAVGGDRRDQQPA